ncbi:MAG: Spy/CpxP family protein refolding chaperone [Thermodesulfobacteriota bacterium]
MKKKTIVGLGLVLAVALMATVAFAWGPGRGIGWGPGYGYPAIPNLTAEQSSKIQALQKSYLDEIAPLQQDLLKKKTELRSLWLSPNPDQAKITALQKEILNLQSKIAEKATNLRLEIRKILTPEQQAQLSLYGPGIGRGIGKMGRMGRW